MNFLQLFLYIFKLFIFLLTYNIVYIKCENENLSCGPKEVPYGISIDSNGTPKIFCQFSPCIFYNKSTTTKFINGFENDEYANCSNELIDNSCSGETEWTAGLFEINNSTHILLKTKCCDFHRMSTAVEYKSSILMNNDYYIGGKTNNFSEIPSYDLIKEVIKRVTEQNEFYYIVSIYRIQCLTNAPSFYKNDIETANSIQLSNNYIDNNIPQYKTHQLNNDHTQNYNYIKEHDYPYQEQKSFYKKPTQGGNINVKDHSLQVMREEESLDYMNNDDNTKLIPQMHSQIPFISPITPKTEVERPKAAGGIIYHPISASGCGNGCGSTYVQQPAYSCGTCGGVASVSDYNSIFSSLHCFSGDMNVITPTGIRKMKDVKIGDTILSMEESSVTFNKVIGFLHRKPNLTATFNQLITESKKELKLTDYHLIYKSQCDSKDSKIILAYAKDIKTGDCVYTLIDSYNNNKFLKEKVKEIKKVEEIGIYSPLTTSGDIIVNNFLASCHNNFAAQSLQQTFFKSWQSVANFVWWVKKLLYQNSDFMVNSHYSIEEEFDIPFGVKYIINVIDMIVPVKMFI
uniref:Hint domain-containing protein n=1 Tax=Strongyloides stercoralis TaxID=6248 RepID=A0A0K0E1W9_STRER